MIVYSVSTLSRTGSINIGYATETGVTQIGFDCSTWLERWPDMTVEVWVTAPGAASAYEAKTHRKGDVIVWEVMQSDTQTPGAGRVEVIGYTADKRKLSATVNTRIDDSMLMAEGTEPPEAQQPWYTAAQEAKARAEAIARNAPIIENGVWMLWDPDKGEYVSSGVQAQGPKGDAAEGGGLPEGAGPWMQLVTGADGVARWEPRLAYAETEETVIVREATLVAIVDPDNPNTFALIEPLASPIALGMNCTVTYNGTQYNCPVQEVPVDGDKTTLALGNVGLGMGGEDTGEPFVFSVIPDFLSDQIPGVYAMVVAYDGAENVTIAITGVAEKVKPIDDKYLHGETRTVILAETTLEYNHTDVDGYAEHALLTPPAARLSAGMVCDVMYNGKAYSLTAKSVADGELLAVGLGNVGAMVDGEEVTGEPFCIIQPPEALAASLGYLLVTDYDGTESVTLSITAKTAGGASGGGILYVTARLDDSTAEPAITHASHTYEEIDAAVQAGKFCVLKLDAAGGTGAMVFFSPLLSKENIDGEAYKFTLAMNGAQIIIGVTRAGWLMMTA